ncbi:uncharacterized protein LOC143869749 [Tasmannia lanceolata]|uniref:uncharacterized protein LOC143869749 n=1 Tax=Tasmannia lanceolata TaxID=3420 RepID=UPI0040643A59
MGGSSTREQRPTQPGLTRGGSVREVGSKDPALCRKGNQRSLKSMWGTAREAVGRAYAKFAFYNAIPANAVTSPYLQHFVDVAGEYGRGVKAPTSYEIMNKYLPLEVEDLKKYINGLKQQWPEYGVTIMTDGWTGSTRQSIINFMVYCDGKTVFLKSIGEKNVVQIVTDNGSNYKKAGQKIMEKYHIFWNPCAAHCIDLMLKDIGKTESVKNVVAEAISMTNFIYNHEYVLSLMREKCRGDLVRHGLTRFATNYVALQSMLDKKIKAFRDAVGAFGVASAVAGRSNTTPAEWWVLYGTDAPNLRSLAINFLSQTASSSGCERNWSTFNFIHSKPRNRLGYENLHNLVYVHYNTRLRLKHREIDSSREAYTDPTYSAQMVRKTLSMSG